jgi:histidine triad (HIT) family protein
MSFLIPAQRLYETDTLVAFYHPHPAYALHILIVPKRAYASMLEVKPEDGAFLRDLVLAVQALVGSLGLEKKGYRLITNGGTYQDVAVLHFHLISE